MNYNRINILTNIRERTLFIPSDFVMPSDFNIPSDFNMIRNFIKIIFFFKKIYKDEKTDKFPLHEYAYFRGKWGRFKRKKN